MNEKDTDLKRFVSPQELADFWCVGRKTIYRWERDGRIPRRNVTLPNGQKRWLRATILKLDAQMIAA